MEKKLFNVEEWAAKAHSQKSEKRMVVPQSAPMCEADETAEKVRLLVDSLFTNKVDITEPYPKWLNVGFGFAMVFGEVAGSCSTWLASSTPSTIPRNATGNIPIVLMARVKVSQ